MFRSAAKKLTGWKDAGKAPTLRRLMPVVFFAAYTEVFVPDAAINSAGSTL